MPHLTNVQHTGGQQVRVANHQQITSVARGTIPLANTRVQMSADVFDDNDLASNLIALPQACNQQCTAILTNTDILVLDEHGTNIMAGTKDPASTKWPLAPVPAHLQSKFTYNISSTKHDTHNPTITPEFEQLYSCTHIPDINDSLYPAQPDATIQFAHLMIANESHLDKVQWLGASVGSPVPSTLFHALDMNWFDFPGVERGIVQRNYPYSIETAMGHLDIQRQHAYQRSFSTETPIPAAEVNNVIIIKSHLIKDIFQGDLAMEYPVRSNRGHKHVLVAVFNNNIHIVPMKDKAGPAYMEAYREAVEHFSKHIQGPPTVCRIDNEPYTAVRSYLHTTAGMELQFVPPGNHRGLAAERAVRTFKCHLLSTLATADADFDEANWDLLLPHVELCLNILRPDAHNPDISAYHGYCGSRYNFNRHPLAPGGTRVVVHDRSSGSWGPHGIRGFCVGAALNHSRCFRCFVPTTGKERIADSIAWVSPTRPLPGASTQEHLLAQIHDMTTTLNNIASRPLATLTERQAHDNLYKSLVSAFSNWRNLYGQPNDANFQRVSHAVTPSNNQLNSHALTTVSGASTAHTADPAHPSTTTHRKPRPPRQRPKTAHPQKPQHPTAQHFGNKSQRGISQHNTHPRTTRTHLPKPTFKSYVRIKPTGPTKPCQPRQPTYIAPKPTNQRDIVNTRNEEWARSWTPPPPGTTAQSAYAAFTAPTDEPSPFAHLRTGKCGASYVYSAEPVENPPLSRQDIEELFQDIITPDDMDRMAAMSVAALHRDDADRLAKLNIDALGRALTLARCLEGPEAEEWRKAYRAEMQKLIPTIMHPIKLNDIPSDRRKDVVYFNPVVKEKLNEDGTKDFRVRGVAGGNLLKGKVLDTTALTAELEVSKIHIHSAVSDDAGLVMFDIKDYYLNSPMDRSEYMRIDRKHLTPDIIADHNLDSFLTKDGAVYVEITRGLYGLPHAGALAQKHLIPFLAEHGYHQSPDVPCLFRHATNGVTFTLVVDDFCVKFKDRAAAEHLLDALRKRYTVKADWEAKSYLGMALRFFTNSDGVRNVALSMPGYIAKALNRFRPAGVHGSPSPSLYEPVHNYGSREPQDATHDASAPLDDAAVLELQQIVGVFLYYARAIDSTMLTSVCELASALSHPTQHVRERMERLLSYAAAHPDHELVYAACDMVLFSQSDASYLSRIQARSVAGGLHYLSNIGQPLMVNGAISAVSKVIPAVVASAAEAEYAALFLNGQVAAWLRTILGEMGYPQPPTMIMTDNETAVGIATGKCKIKRSKSMDMRWHWIRDRVKQGQFSVHWISGAQNIADFFTKSIPIHKHAEFTPILVHAPPAMKPIVISLSSRSRRSLAWRQKAVSHTSYTV